MVVLGDNGQHTSAHLLSQICKGKGANSNQEAHYLSPNYLNTSLSLAKPLRELVARELQLYNHYK